MRDRQDDVVAALDALREAIEQNSREEQLLVERLDQLRRACESGAPVTKALEHEASPGTLQLLGNVLSRLMETSGSARRALARKMRAEGTSIPAIARTFGVTHQRVSNILNRPEGQGPGLHATRLAEQNDEEEEDQERMG